MKNKNYRRLLTAAVACVSLGLAPFTPEPHIVGKIRWVLGGGNGMAFADVFDLFLHGLPWIWFAYETFRLLRK